MEKFEHTGSEVSKLLTKLSEECKGFLNDNIDEGENIDIDIMCEKLNECCCVSYDGGRHPEYNSNCFSSVYEVFKKDGKIYLCTEDCNELSIDRITTMELYDICDLIVRYDRFYTPKC